MKRLLAIFSVLSLATACQEREMLTFEALEIGNSPCSNCPEIKISLPEAMGKGKLAGSINTALKEEVISMLIFDDSTHVNSLDDAVASFENAYSQIKALYPDEAVGWKAEIRAAVSFEDADRVSIAMNVYTFTGGAHGYEATHYLNFDKHRGTELERWELFRNEAEFEGYAEVRFREFEHIPVGQNINSTGFMFEEDKFYLPENIGFTSDGLLLYYNQYEVASYADGPIALTLPFGEVNPYLAFPVKQ